MKTEEVLERYQAGQRDFQGKDLRGQSFKGQNLSGADFSEAKIQGTNFTNAYLKGANFSCAKGGLQSRPVIGLVISSWLLAAASGFFSAYICCFVEPKPFSMDHSNFTFGIVALLAVFFILIIRQGFGAVAVAIAVAVAGAGAATVAVAVADAVPNAALSAAVPAAVLTNDVAFTVAGAGVATVAATGAVAGAVAGAGAATVAGAGAGAVAGAVAVAVVGAAVVGAAVVGVGPGYTAPDVAVAVTLLSAYISWRALEGDEKHALIRKIAIAFAATGGTNFRGADLTDANFTQATLKNTNFSDANLTRTRFYETKQLHLARTGNSILATQAVLDLLVSGNGKKKSYENANLRGAYLLGADLQKAHLKNANISEATFEGACLEWANLTLTQAVGTNFTNAQMTGACVEAWNIEHTTILDDVDCRFIYLLEHPKPGTDERERRPSSGEFKPEEFTKLLQEVFKIIDLIFRNGIDWEAFDTIDLIFRNGIDWKVFLATFKKVQVENEGTELVIQSIEDKGDGVLVVKVKVPPDINKEKIYSEFTQLYELALKAAEEKYRVELKAKDEQIAGYRERYTDIKEIVSELARISVNVEVNNRAESKVMNQSNDQSQKIEIGSVGGDFNPSGQAFNLGSIDISGTVINTIDQLQESNTSEASQLADLLKQLQTAIEKEENLNEEDKIIALEQVKELAKAGQKPEEGAMQKAAKAAITMLKGIRTGLPATATLVEACSKLLPVITKLFGLS